MLLRGALLLTLFFCAETLQAATYFLRTDGHDTNCNGTTNAAASAAPNCGWLTLQKAMNTAVAGDTVRIQDGTYVSSFLLMYTSGSAGNPITFVAEHQHLAIISDIGDCFNPIIGVYASYITFDGLRFQKNAAAPTCSESYILGAIRFWSGNEGISPSLAGTQTTLYHHGIARNIYIDDDPKLYDGMKTNQDYSIIEYCTCYRPVEPFNGLDQIIRYNTIYSYKQNGNFIVTKGGARNTLVYGNTVINRSQHGGGTGIILGGGGWGYWERNTSSPTQNITCYNCAAFNNVVVNQGSNANEGGIGMWACSDCYIFNNVVIAAQVFLARDVASGEPYTPNINPTFHNNIVVAAGQNVTLTNAYSDLNGWESPHWTGTRTLTYNTFYGFSGNIPSQSAGALTTDPLFVNSLSDWHLQTGSPALNSAVAVAVPRYGGGFNTVNFDRAGVGRPQGELWDRGIYEAIIAGPVISGGFLQDQGTLPQHARLSTAEIAAFMTPNREKFTFPAPYNTTGYRLTIPSDCGSADCVDYVGYGYWATMNAHEGDADILIFLGLRKSRGGIGPTLFRFNKATEVVTKVGPLFEAASDTLNLTAGIDEDLGGENWYWSASNHDVIYMPQYNVAPSYGGPKLYRFNVQTKVFTQVFDVTTEFGSDRAFIQASSSVNDTVHAASLRVASTGAMLGCVVYDESVPEWHYYASIATLDECHIDQSGRYLVMLEDTIAPVLHYNRFFDITTGAESRITGPDYTLGHYATGYGYFLGADDTNAMPNATIYYQMNPFLRGPVIHYNPNWNLMAMFHMSHLNAKPYGTLVQQMFCGAIATADFTYPTDITCTRIEQANQQMIVAPVMTDTNATGGAWNNGYYGQQPKGSLDTTGTYYLWTSNLGGSRLDAFMVKVPRQLLMGGDDVGPSVPVNFEVQ